MTGVLTPTNGVLANDAFAGVTQSLANRASPLDALSAYADAREAAQSFEAFFISQMLADMFAGVETDPVFGGGPGETVFRSLMIDEYGKAVAKTGGIGITDNVMREIVRMQELNTNDR